MKHYFENTKYIKYYFNIIEKANNEDRNKLKKSEVGYIYFEGHHILPVSLFKEFENFNDNPWNKILLTAKEHFVCHLLLMKHYKSLNDKNGYIKMSKAMNNLNNNGKYNSKIYEYYRLNFEMSDEQKIKISNTKNKEIILEDGTITTSAKIGAQKMVQKMDYKSNGIKGSKTLNKEIILEDGSISSIAKERGKKAIETMKTKTDKTTGLSVSKSRAIKTAKTLFEVEENGKTKRENINSKTAQERNKEYWDGEQKIFTTHYKEVAKKREEKRMKWHKLFHKDSGFIRMISQKECKELHASLLKTSKEDYLGSTDRKYGKLKKYNKLELFGLYIIKE